MSVIETEGFEKAKADQSLLSQGKMDTDELARIAAEADSGTAADLLGKRTTIGGIEIRPVTLATITMLKQIRSPLIEGVAVSTIENVLLEILIFITIHTLPFEEAADLCFDRKAMQRKALEMADKVAATDIPKMISETMNTLKRATETQVKAEDASKGGLPPELAKIHGGGDEGKA